MLCKVCYERNARKESQMCGICAKTFDEKSIDGVIYFIRKENQLHKIRLTEHKEVVRETKSGRDY